MLEVFEHENPVRSVAIDPNGHFIFTVSVNAHKWSANGTCLHSYFGHSERVTSIAVANGVVITGSMDGTAKLWDLKYNLEM